MDRHISALELIMAKHDSTMNDERLVDHALTLYMAVSKIFCFEIFAI